MVAETKFFGIIDIEEDKIIDFVNGIIGFENMHQFAIVYDVEKGKDAGISWLQSMEEPSLALPVVDPFAIMEDYNPIVEDELLAAIGNPLDEEIYILLAMTVPSDITKVTVNLKAPFIINTTTRQAKQMIVDNSDYAVKYNVYEAVQKMKEKAGE